MSFEQSISGANTTEDEQTVRTELLNDVYAFPAPAREDQRQQNVPVDHATASGAELVSNPRSETGDRPQIVPTYIPPELKQVDVFTQLDAGPAGITVGPYKLTIDQIRRWVNRMSEPSLMNQLIRDGEVSAQTGQVVKSRQLTAVLGALDSGQTLPPAVVARFLPKDMQEAVAKAK